MIIMVIVLIILEQLILAIIIVIMILIMIIVIILGVRRDAPQLARPDAVQEPLRIQMSFDIIK